MRIPGLTGRLGLRASKRRRAVQFGMCMLAPLLLSCMGMSFAANLRGAVVDNSSGMGIAGATVQLLLAGAPAGETLTNDEGTFAFDGMAVGGYTAMASKDGYVNLLPGAFGSTRVSDRETPPVVLRLARTCAIAGRVFDDAGRPMPDVKVVALARRSGGGRVRLAQQGGAFSDDRGEYRLWGLAPGRYTIAAISDGDQVGSLSFASVYFPGTVEQSRAEFFDVASGESRNGLDLSLVSIPTSEVSGTVRGIPDDWSGRRTAVAIFEKDGGAMETVYAGPDGHFVFRQVPPGSYQIVAWGPIVGWGSDGPVATPRGRQGFRKIEAGAAVSENVEIELQSLGNIDASVALASGDAPACAIGARLALRPLDSMPESRAFEASFTRQRFVVPDVPCARYRVELLGLHGTCYLKDVRIDGRKADASNLAIDGSSHLKLLLSVDAATISGRLGEPGNNRFDARDAVVVVPTTPDEAAPEGTRIAPVDGDGQFRITVPPGTYQVLAVRNVQSLDYLDPVFLSDHDAVWVAVEAGTSTTLNLVNPK